MKRNKIMYNPLADAFMPNEYKVFIVIDMVNYALSGAPELPADLLDKIEKNHPDMSGISDLMRSAHAICEKNVSDVLSQGYCTAFGKEVTVPDIIESLRKKFSEKLVDI